MKKLTVNTAACDMRNVTAQQLAPYDAIEINSAAVYTSPETQELLSSFPVMINSSNMLTLDQGVKFSLSNGPHTIGPGAASEEKTALLVNGPLDILPGAEEALNGYVQINVNGPLTCPASMGSLLGNVLVNGPRILYPDGAILLKSPVLTRQFLLSAQAKPYYASTLAAVDPALDFTLLPRGFRLHAEKVVAAESLLEHLLPLISEDAEIIPVPDGTAYVARQLFLEPYTPKQYGTKLYVDGDLFCQEDHVTSLDWVEYLAVSGNAMLSESLVELFAEKAASFGGIRVMPTQTGRRIADRTMVTVDDTLLSLSPEGLQIADCAQVELAPDLSADVILNSLTLRDCPHVHCTTAQMAALSTVAENCGYVGPAAADDYQETVINTAQYTF